MKAHSICYCPGCSRSFKTSESSYSATRLDHDGQALHIKDTLLCGRCSRHANQQTRRGEMIVKRLLAQVTASGPECIPIVH